MKIPFERTESDHVAGTNLTKGSEETVTMACESYVPQLPGHSSVWKVAYASTQDLRRIALKNNSPEFQPWYLNLANSFANSR